MAAYRIGDPNKQFAVKRCEDIEKSINNISELDSVTKQDFPINPSSAIRTTQDR